MSTGIFGGGQRQRQFRPRNFLAFHWTHINMSEELLNQILKSSAITSLTAEQQQILSTVTPVLFDALPALLKTIDQRTEAIDHVTLADLDGERSNDIKPLQFLGQYMFRHNPKYATEGKSNVV